MTDEREEWKPVSEWPYEVSNLGRVRRVGGSPLRPYAGNPCGYLTVGLHNGGRQITRTVHRLVCEAFHGERPSPTHLVAHFDGDKHNNRSSNLRWATPLENADDDARNGARPVRSGEHNGHAKFSADDIRKIMSSEDDNPTIAARFNVHTTTIWRIRTGRTWAAN